MGTQSEVLHNFINIDESNKSMFDRCKRCGLELTSRKADNKLYLKTHKRDFLQPHGRTAREFKREYGQPNHGGRQEQGEAEDGVKDLVI